MDARAKVGRETLDERVRARTHVSAVKVLGAEQLFGITRSDKGESVISELRLMTFDGGELSCGKLADLHDERRRRRKGAERIGVRDAKDLVWGLTVHACCAKGHRDMLHELSHPAAGHRDVIQRRRVRAQRSHGCSGSLVNRDVIGMAVEAVFAESNHHVRPQPVDRAADVGFETLGVSPGQHAVLVVEQYQVCYAEDLRGVPQFLNTDVANICRSWSELSCSGAADRHAGAEVGAPGKQPSTRQ